MPAIAASAPGKIILFGEHAVVYGRPAIAVPVEGVSARAVVMAEPLAKPGAIHLIAPDIDLDAYLSDLKIKHPLALAVEKTLATLDIQHPPAFTVRITSTIPLAAGLGSGAAVSVAIIRAVSAFLGQSLSEAQVSGLAYEVEQVYHGTPSGIDNTVIAYKMPVYFRRGQPIEILHVGKPFTIVIGDTGIKFPTAVAVGDVRKAWQANPDYFEALFDSAGEIARTARQAIENGAVSALGLLMYQNHLLLQQMGVSSPELDRLVEAARRAGAVGAKLSGGGRGGNMIALVDPGTAAQVEVGLQNAGAVRTLVTEIRPASRS
jgi:mevalonate kinase